MSEEDNNTIDKALVGTINKMITIIVILLIAIVLIPFIVYLSPTGNNKNMVDNNQSKTEITSPSSINTHIYWEPVEISSIKDQKLKAQVEYGKELIANTAKYLGPNGRIKKISNGMNCQNCHLDAGTKVFGNNYGSVASQYPKMRARSGKVENLYKRVNDCFERSLNGVGLDTNSAEMLAIKAYIEHIGSNVDKGVKAEGSGFKDLVFLERAAEPLNGQLVYKSKCESCHQANGEGLFSSEQNEYIYPPLWGKYSYNDGAGLYRISNFAKYVKYNMPLGVNHQSPMLTDEEAWDVAAYVNSKPRPHKKTPKDWPDISKKPIDHPFGPYSDNFSEKQHKFGPFKPIEESHKKSSTSSQKKST